MSCSSAAVEAQAPAVGSHSEGDGVAATGTSVTGGAELGAGETAGAMVVGPADGIVGAKVWIGESVGKEVVARITGGELGGGEVKIVKETEAEGPGVPFWSGSGNGIAVIVLMDPVDRSGQM